LVVVVDYHFSTSLEITSRGIQMMHLLMTSALQYQLQLQPLTDSPMQRPLHQLPLLLRQLLVPLHQCQQRQQAYQHLEILLGDHLQFLVEIRLLKIKLQLQRPPRYLLAFLPQVN
jgi:hypothetical protein